MNEMLPIETPNNQLDENFENRLIETARAFTYPQTPNISRSIGQRMPMHRPAGHGAPLRLVIAGAVAALILAVVLIVPPVRAAVVQWIQIGAARIFLIQPTPTQVPTLPPGTPTPVIMPSPTPVKSILDLSGETTLADAQSRAGFTIQTPSFPPDLGKPDHVYFQDLNGPVIILVWMDPNQPGKVRMSLSETASGMVMFQKFQAKTIEDTQVNGRGAIWVEGQYLLITGNGETVLSRLVDQSHTLIWAVGAMTFRLETDTDLTAAVHTAESVH